MAYRFFSQWDEDRPTWSEVNDLPSCTIPDQSMTISEIIARFTRTGVMPVPVHTDDGGNVAVDDPEFDPLEFDPAYFKSEAERLKAKLGQNENANKDSENMNENTPATE